MILEARTLLRSAAAWERRQDEVGGRNPQRWRRFFPEWRQRPEKNGHGSASAAHAARFPVSASSTDQAALSSVPPCVVETDAVDRWFKDEVHLHDSSLKAYLRASFRSVRDVDDIVQESYLRIWKAKLSRPIESTKSFLFSVARHLAIDVVRKGKTFPVDSLGDLSDLPVLQDTAGALDGLCYEEKVELLAAAFLDLPPRCRKIMTLRKLHGIPNAEIAAAMGISERTVENQITRGTRLCRKFLVERGCTTFLRE